MCAATAACAAPARTPASRRGKRGERRASSARAKAKVTGGSLMPEKPKKEKRKRRREKGISFVKNHLASAASVASHIRPTRACFLPKRSLCLSVYTRAREGSIIGNALAALAKPIPNQN